MLDFVQITSRLTRTGWEIYPKFLVVNSEDLMIRGGDFYAIWLEDKNRWSTDELDVVKAIDIELRKYAEEHKNEFGVNPYIKFMSEAETGVIDSWHRYCQKQRRDSFHVLDEKIIFADATLKKEDYASKTLPYTLGPGDMSGYETLMSTLYFPEERHKLEWAIGSIVCGDSKKIQKFLVLYGEGGTGKSTVINIIDALFSGYTSVFDAKALGSSNNAFALEAFKSNPLVAIQHDGDLSHIEDNTRLNSLVSHETMIVNEKFKTAYSNRFNAFLIMGSNKPVKITDARSGIIRRLIDVSPSGNLLPKQEYDKAVGQIAYELGAIADHCLKVYKENPKFYDNYIPEVMISATNDFYNFVLHEYPKFKTEDGTTAKAAWASWKEYKEEANIQNQISLTKFKEELKPYFKHYYERYALPDGSRVRSYFQGFRVDKFDIDDGTKNEEKKDQGSWIELKEQKSVFDDLCSGMFAQEATEDGKPATPWDKVKTLLRDINTRKLHYVRIPENHIVIDFDIPGPDGEKSLERNLEEASKWPPTYCELSKSGKGVHLHYFYNGDVSTLNRLYDEHIEVKIFTGKSSLRRLLTLCNDLPLRTISSGLPLRGEKKVVDFEGIKSELHLRAIIAKALRKEIHPNTRPAMDLVYKTVESAYNGGLSYDISDLQNSIIAFALHSTHQSDYCLKLESKLHYKSEDRLPQKTDNPEDDESDLVFFDCEVFPNLFLVNWKVRGKGRPIIRWVNPGPTEMTKLLSMKLIGFNNRDYDNHMLYGCLLGETCAQLFERSQKLINSEKKYTDNESRKAHFGEAYGLSYSDIYDFSSEKKSLKKWEIELGIHHQELGLPWNEPVPEELWDKVSEYCDNDVLATEAVFDHLEADWDTRKMLSEITGMSRNSTTNSLSAALIFGENKHPQNEFNYRFMGDMNQELHKGSIDGHFIDDFTMFNDKNQPVFPGYTYDWVPIIDKKTGLEKSRKKMSLYRGEEVGEGGEVFANPGMWFDLALLDVASMHPTSALQEMLFGIYTKNFEELKQIRVDIKHKDFESAKKRFGGKLAKFLDDAGMAKKLAKALKIVINAVYGCTKAGFENPFRDPRNEDNIVAKRGALFMINLRHAVEERGYVVAHIKTDSIKIPNATPEIIKFVTDYGHLYGYDFEHEATYERMCLVNDAVYIAKFATVDHCYELYGKEYVDSSPDICKENKEEGGQWTATGTQFAVPYVFKKCFTHEPIVFSDLCETKSASSALYLNMNEETNGENNYRFVGKVGAFCPIRSGCGGGELMRLASSVNGVNNYASATGTKGYRWLESEYVQELGKESDIDISYYDELVNKAIEEISKYGDYYMFAESEPYTNAA